MSREVLQHYLTPGGVDGFLGVGMEPVEDTMSMEGGEKAGYFNIPKELLVDMPIADVTANTRIIHLGFPGMANRTVLTPQPRENIEPPHPKSPRPGTSGVTTIHEQEAMDVEAAATAVTAVPAVTPVNPANVPQVVEQQHAKIPHEGRAKARPQGPPKKGLNTKNRNVNAEPAPQGEAQDGTLKERMSLLEKITDIMKSSYGSRRDEMEVWGHYIGLKARKIPEGRRRDRVLMNVEEMITEATYDDM